LTLSIAPRHARSAGLIFDNPGMFLPALNPLSGRFCGLSGGFRGDLSGNRAKSQKLTPLNSKILAVSPGKRLEIKDRA
jgi:hypothetical protein